MGRQPCCDKVGVKRGPWTIEEDHKLMSFIINNGSKPCRWFKIATHFPGRTDNEIKNHWNTRIKKRLKLLGLDPLTKKQNTSKGYEENVEIKSLHNNGTKEMKKTKEKIEEKENKVTWDAEFHNYEIQSSKVDFGSCISQENNTSVSSYCSSSFSIDDSSYPYVGQFPYLEGNSLQQWVDSMDSILSWDSLNPLEEDFHLLENKE